MTISVLSGTRIIYAVSLNKFNPFFFNVERYCAKSSVLSVTTCRYQHFVRHFFKGVCKRDARLQSESLNSRCEKLKNILGPHQIFFFFFFQDRLLNSLADLTTLCIFLAISPSVRESASMVARGDLREMELFRQFHVQASAVQRESINWLQIAVPSVFEPNRVDYIHCLRKVIIGHLL